MAQTGSTTRAILIVRHGRPEVLVEREVPLPDPGPEEVHVRVRAAGVNFADLLMRAGLYSTVPPMPYSAGFEVAGEVVRVGSSVGGWRAGDRAAALLRYGGQARDVIVPAGQLFRYPERLTPVQAAAIPVIYLTGWVALFEAARARAGETALILNAAGGVGTAATQLAVRAKLRAIGTAGNPRKREFVVKELGAAACYDSRGAWAEEVLRFAGPRSIDVALDAVGGRAAADCERLLAPLGRHVFYGLSDALPGAGVNWLRAALAWLRTPSVRPVAMIERNTGIFGIHLLHLLDREAVLRSALEEIYRLVGAGDLKPVIDRTFPLTQVGAVEAHHYLHARKNTGKVVLEATDATDERPARSAR